MNLDLRKLNYREKEIVFSLSVIPFSMFSVPELREMFRISDDEQFLFFDTIHDLSLKGFLKRHKANYGLPLSIARFILENGKPTFEDCPTLINYLSSFLEKEKPDFEKEFTPAYKKLEYLFQKISGKSFNLAQLSYLLSSNLVKFKKFEEALKYNQLAVDISEAIDRRHPSIAIYYRNKALIHKKLGDTKMSIYYSLKDIEILELNAGRYDDLLPGSYFNLSKTYEDLHDYEKAIEYNLKAIQIEKKRKPQRFINLSGLYHNLAYYYMKLNNLHDASLFIDKAVENYSKGKIPNSEQFKTLLRDQKRFKSLFRFEQFVIKYKYPILIFLIIIVFLIIWGILELFI